MDDVAVDIDKISVIGLVSTDHSGRMWLESLMRNKPLIPSDSLERLLKDSQELLQNQVSYVPDDIVKDSDMTPEQILHGYALSFDNGKELKQAGLELLNRFSVDCKKNIAALSDEQNKVFIMISALLQPSKLYLLDKPGNFIGRTSYINLLKEFTKKLRKGVDIIIAEEHVSDIILPCNQYIFLKDGEIVERLKKSELPGPAKIVTMKDGNWMWMACDKTTIIQNSGNEAVFLCQEMSASELALRICKSDCKDFKVDDISVEDIVLGNFQRWSL